MQITARAIRILSTTAVLAALAACDSSPLLEPGAPSDRKSATPGSPTDDWLQLVKQVTARYNSTTQAEQAGYLRANHCVAAPGIGGMGQHWVNPSLVDPVFDPLNPEVVLYAPGPNGKPQLVALEYVVLNVGQAAPVFGDQPFDVGGAPIPAPHWTLHVWLYEHNPSGTFAPFNPNVHCH